VTALDVRASLREADGGALGIGIPLQAGRRRLVAALGGLLSSTAAFIDG